MILGSLLADRVIPLLADATIQGLINSYPFPHRDRQALGTVAGGSQNPLVGLTIAVDGARSVIIDADKDTNSSVAHCRSE